MTTRDDMVAEIEDDTERSDSAAIVTKINKAIRYYQGERFWFNESRDTTFSTVIAQTDYAVADLGAEFYEIDGIFVTQGTNILQMRPRDYREIEQLLDGASTSSLPAWYAYVAGALRFYPSPDQVYPVRVTGHIKKAEPAIGAEANNVWMNEGYNLIIARAKAELFAHRWEDPTNAAIMLQAERMAFSELKSKTAGKIGTGSFRPTQF